ncbi:hypothetical protein [Rhizobium laguerreae]|uniref:hypothetical protein n=1 Tax=Rhizobium laguerreae TaxID=1076926 RepID=UPI001C8FF130|nr:hypothetical protein [Rhizobium laguerreae]MBY3201767.1 hypothetical protein [Rhizobium laguerreae]
MSEKLKVAVDRPIAGQWHDTLISVLPRRRWLKSHSLMENKWIIETEDPETKRFTEEEIDFDVPLVGWPHQTILTDPTSEHDLITAKRFLFYVQEPRPLGWSKVALSARREFESWLQFTRWRLNRGILFNADLTKEWHTEYMDSLRERGSEGLLRMTNQAELLVSSFRRHELAVPLNGSGKVDGVEIARLMGVRHSNSITKEARNVLYEYFDEAKLVRGKPGFSIESKLPESSDIVDPNENTIYKKAAVWHHLWWFRDKLDHDPIGCQIYHNKKEIAAAIKGWTKRSDVTPDPPAYQTSWLINAALALILDGSASKIIDIADAGLTELGAPRALLAASELAMMLKALGHPPLKLAFMEGRSTRDDESIDLRTLTYEILPAACAIVILAFSARRAEEGMSLTSDCIECDSAGNVWLKSLIEKGEGRIDRVPVPVSVKAAVDVLRRLRAIRPPPHGNFIFEFRCGFSNRQYNFDLGRALKRFSAWARVPALEDGSFWSFAPHQLRKFFGVTYFWRYSFPSLIALSLQYRHFNPETTMGYITTQAKDMLRLWDEGKARLGRKSQAEKIALDRLASIESGSLVFVKDILHRVASGEQMSGSMGRLINAKVGEIRNQFSLTLQLSQAELGPPGFENALNELAKSVRLKVHPEGHGMCGLEGNLQDACNANCLVRKQAITGVSPQAATGPALDFADDLGCLVCPLHARLPEFQNYWADALREVDTALSASAGGQRAHLVERKRIIQAHAGASDA